MKSFKNYIKPNLEDLYEGTNVSMKDFIKAVNSYSNIDDALASLPDEYTEFYIKNINNKDLSKELKKLKLVEDWEYSPDQTTQMSPQPGKFKRIHYKGDYIIMKYTEGQGWTPYLTFRSISKALRFAKGLADEYS